MDTTTTTKKQTEKKFDNDNAKAQELILDAVKQSQEMLDVVFQANDFLLNVTAVDQKRGFLEDAFLVGTGAQQFLKARLEPFRIAL